MKSITTWLNTKIRTRRNGLRASWNGGRMLRQAFDEVGYSIVLQQVVGGMG